jgi:hypothetical protein
MQYSQRLYCSFGRLRPCILPCSIPCVRSTRITHSTMGIRFVHSFSLLLLACSIESLLIRHFTRCTLPFASLDTSLVAAHSFFLFSSSFFAFSLFLSAIVMQYYAEPFRTFIDHSSLFIAWSLSRTIVCPVIGSSSFARKRRLFSC